jgi:hypothetical protein
MTGAVLLLFKQQQSDMRINIPNTVIYNHNNTPSPRITGLDDALSGIALRYSII